MITPQTTQGSSAKSSAVHVTRVVRERDKMNDDTGGNCVRNASVSPFVALKTVKIVKPDCHSFLKSLYPQRW